MLLPTPCGSRLGTPPCSAARIAVAIGRAKVSNATPEIPKLIDPYSGEPMRVKRDDQSYAVYSVGSNGRDDGGHTRLDDVPPCAIN